MTATASARTLLPPRLATGRIIAVLRAPRVDALAPVCDVLVEEGILGLELTLTTPDLLGSVRRLIDRYSGSADVGLGTVTTTEQAQQGIDAGAAFLVTPAMNLPVIDRAVASSIAVIPGGLTPSELITGWDAGATAVKIFPAQTVGPDYLRHLHGPFPGLPAVPSGGIDLDSTHDWLAAGAVAVSLGGPLLGDALTGGDLEQLRERCRAIRAVVDHAPRT
ncbi:bifunctional 4-hydroxy-2-oxoglutarate aldolase/2-dehydro-3-deoxy-phosphogluconate aldolase [Microbacterium lacus]|uniref:bifunctional 4-hydroxy-2-oxoglutarate aldolase/2-dehydro-3-deoxy-phosphogluconate aldolase n=1 Tax=Microbacterium lacus TaxID=415217 RepID=UPI003850F5C6